MISIDESVLKNRIRDFLLMQDKIETYYHCINVGKTAQEIGKKYLSKEDLLKATLAGYLHDISAIYPNEDRVLVAKRMGIELCKEEIEFPLIIHQKISKKIAEEVFDIHDKAILSAIECHTTLKENFSTIDLIVFLADKISWDGGGRAYYHEELMSKLEVSLESAALFYISSILEKGLQVEHPWLLGANHRLRKLVKIVK